MTKISNGHYKDVNAIILENDVLLVKLLPEFGSKIASIYHKQLKYESLWQNPGKKYKRTSYGDSYSSGEFSGFDEMFPSITQCIYERMPLNKIEIPDHGEVWSIPWSFGFENEQVVFTVDGIKLPYTLWKRVSLCHNCIHIEYKAINTSETDFDFIWAAHPLFKASKGMEFIVPYGMNQVINSVPGERLPGYGTIYDFPIANIGNSNKLNLAVVPEQNKFGFQKYYFNKKVTEGWCVLRYPELKLDIRLAYPSEQVPFLGMWLNEGGWDDQYNIAPEPATAPMDSITASKIWNMNSTLKPKHSYKWYLDILFN